jgi:hypothetical protein
MTAINDVGSKHKCAHMQCRCQVPTSEKYCSNYCADADKVKDIEIECDCKHKECELD